MLTLIDGVDYESRPVGGQLTFCKQLLKEFEPGEICIVGVNSSQEPVRQWFKKTVGGKSYDCFNLYTLSDKIKPIVPLRVMNFISIFLSRRAILKKANFPLLINLPEIMIALKIFNWRHFSYFYIFHGAENPLRLPRYNWGKWFARWFEHLHFKSLKSAKGILVCADRKAIKVLLVRAKGTIKPELIVPFPTRYNDQLFKPPTKSDQDTFQLHPKKKIFVSVGRINKVKGWELLLDAFNIYRKNEENKNSFLVFVGDGEDRQLVEEKAEKYGISEHIKITGFLPEEAVRSYLWNADIFLVGSYVEGWSIAILEALACGNNVVSTAVSGVNDMIEEGINGFICRDREPKKYAELINIAVTDLKKPNKRSIEIASYYRLSNLRQELIRIISCTRRI